MTGEQLKIATELKKNIELSKAIINVLNSERKNFFKIKEVIFKLISKKDIVEFSLTEKGKNHLISQIQKDIEGYEKELSEL